MLSNIATNGGHCENSPFFDGWKAYDKNPYHPTRNPQGVIQMGLAENQLSFDLIEEWVKKNPKASICTPEGASEFMETALYQDYHGLPAFRNAVAKFMEKVRGGRAKFDPDRIVMSGGATGAHELISFCLADPGEAFLVPTPYYSGFDRDLCWRTGVKLVPVPCHSSNDFKITRTSLESAYKKAQESNTKIKGLLITNPSNPLGTVLDRQILTTILDFITEKGIHLVCDEIYGATVFSTPDFISISEILGDSPIHYNPDLIHIIYSLSKDLGIPGFRVGIVYSYNDEVVNCARKMSSFGLVSTQTQRLLAAMLSDSEFTDKFIFKSAQRLAARQSMFTQSLARVGIRCLKSSAGLFCWMDLRSSLTDATVKSETALWRTILEEVKLNISPGSSFHCSEPGWFRVCFANMDDETMEEALKRIRGWRKKRQSLSHCASSLRLSFGRLGESNRTPLASPHWSLMSPRSPLVRAT